MLPEYVRGGETLRIAPQLSPDLLPCLSYSGFGILGSA